MPALETWLYGICAVLIISAMINFSYFLNQLKAVLNVFRRYKLFINTLFLDLLFYMGLFLIVALTFIIVQKDAQSLGQLDLDSIKQQIMNVDVSQQTMDQMANAVSVMKVFFIHIIAYFIISLLIALVLYAIFKGLIWTRMTKQKFTKRFFFKYLGFNFVLLLILSAIGAALAFFTGDYFLSIFVYFFIVFTYFGYFANMLFMRNHKIWRSIGKGFVSGFKYLIKYIVPLTLMFALYMLVFLIIYGVSFFGISLLTTVLYWILMLILFSFIRIYFYDTFVSNTKKKNL